MSGFLAELKRRNVIRMAGLYLVGAWLVVQVAGTLLRNDVPSSLTRCCQSTASTWGGPFMGTDLHGHILMSDRPETERAQALVDVRRALDLAARSTRDPLERLYIDIDRTLYSDDWGGLTALFSSVWVTEGCASGVWAESGIAFGSAVAVVESTERRVACDPLDFTGYYYGTLAANWAGRPERTLEFVTAADRAVGGNVLLTAQRVQALVMLGRLDEARAASASLDASVPVVARAQLLVGAATGDDAAATRARLKGFVRGGWLPEFWPMVELLADALTGDRVAANRWAASVDARPGGPMRLAATLVSCQCGAPFDLEATPNFKARILESGFK